MIALSKEERISQVIRKSEENGLTVLFLSIDNESGITQIKEAVKLG